jgi:hypothetical protein
LPVTEAENAEERRGMKAITNRKEGKVRNINKERDGGGRVEVKTEGAKPKAPQQLESKQFYCQGVTNDKGRIEGKFQASER